MRPGLVGIGVAFLLVGGAALASLYLFNPSGTSLRVNTSTTTLDVTPGAAAGSPALWGLNGSAETFFVAWSATVGVTVTLYAENASCGGTGACSSPLAYVTGWSAARSGNWSGTGSLHFPYYLKVVDTGTAGGSVSVLARGTVQEPVTPSILGTLIGTAAGALVLVVGAVALFLGLFLRRDPYGPPPPPTPGPYADPDTVRGIEDEHDWSEPRR